MARVQSPQIQSDLIQVARALNLFRLGNGIAGVFVPLIILKSGGSLSTVALFYLLYAAVKLCINYSCMRLIIRRGAHFGLGAGFMFSALQIASILAYSHTYSPLLIVVAAACFAATNGFVWNAQHYFIANNMNPEAQSSTIASIEAYGRVFDIIGPIIGGIVGTLFGPFWLLLTASISIIATLVPLRSMSGLFAADPMTLKYSLCGAPYRDLAANFCFNIEAATGTLVWPVYLALTLASYQSIGAIAALATAASIGVTIFAGHRGDKGKDRTVLRQGVTASSLIDLSRVLATTTPVILLTGAAYESSLAYVLNPWVSTYYSHAKRLGPQYIVSMEIACDVAYFVVWGLFYITLLLTDNRHWLFNPIFLLGAAAAWGCLLITPIAKQSIKSMQ